MDPSAHVPLVAAGTAGSRAEAELKRSALEDAGIPARVASDTVGGNDPALAYGTMQGHRVMVAENDLEAARDFLAELDAGEHAIGGPEDSARPLADPPRTHWLVWVGLAIALVFVVARVAASLNLG